MTNTARSADELLRSARSLLPHRPAPAEAAQAQADGALLIDIRGDDQRRNDGLIPGAIVVPRNSFEWRCDPASVWRHPAIHDREQRLIIVCNEGFQSSLAAANLQRMGMRNATDLDGGFVAWRAAGFPVVPFAGSDIHDEGLVRALWDSIYQRGAESVMSWHQEEARLALELAEALRIPKQASVLDAGGGASAFADALLRAGYSDVTVLDVSPRALEVCAQRLGRRRAALHLVCADVLTWQPERQYALWYDRALLHFFVDPDDRIAYTRTLRAAVAPGGGVIIGVFAEDGPAHCSGLPVVRYSAAQLSVLLGSEFHLAAERREEHVTPSGNVQPFQWAAFYRATADR